MNDMSALTWLISLNIKDTFLKSFNLVAMIKPPSHAILIQFVPFTLRPTLDKDLRELEETNNLDTNCITQAKWVKPIE
jgi:hypothetical protein